MHEENFSVTCNSSIVLTWNIAAVCQGTDKNWKQLLQCGKAIVSVTTWFEMQLDTKNTLYIKSTPPVNIVKRRLAPVNPDALVCRKTFQKHYHCTSKKKLFKSKVTVVILWPCCLKRLILVWLCVPSSRQSALTLTLWSSTMTNLTTRCGCSAGETWRRTTLLCR